VNARLYAWGWEPPGRAVVVASPKVGRINMDGSVSDPKHQPLIDVVPLVGNVAGPVIGSLERLLARIIAVEFFAIAAACYAASVVYNLALLSRWPPIEEYVPAALSIALLVLFVALGFKHYAGFPTQPRERYMWSGVGAVALAFCLFLSLLFLFKIADWYSRGTFFTQFGGAAVAILIVRTTTHGQIRRAIRSGAVDARRALFIGDGKLDCKILENLSRSGIRSVGTLPFPNVHGNTVPGIEAFPRNVRSLVERCRSLRPDDIFFLTAYPDLPKIVYVVEALSELPVSIHIIPQGASDLWASAKIAEFGSTVAIQVVRPPLSAVDRVAKRALDIWIAGLGLLVLSPLFLTVSLAIKLDSRGPVFFRQIRHGYNNETIKVLKFRSMTVIEDGYHFKQAVRDDPRVTRIGRILRRTNVDELPQLVNVLLGEMSIVGPRPHPIALNEAFAERISPLHRRHKVKPGITGWAQVNGFRGETDTLEKMQRRVEFDLYYIDNWSFVLDIKIILMTLVSKRAYSNAF
jgi:Undecaprenyl-phosphate glucose phosphotransferase